MLKLIIFFNLNTGLNSGEYYNDIDTIFGNFENLDKTKFIISFHKVWQIEETVDGDLLIKILNSLLEKGFIVDYHSLAKRFHACYADNYNSVVIN